MSDLKIGEFMERAERGLDLPDLAVIERQGRALRQRRLAAALGGFALALVLGAGMANVATHDTDSAPAPANPPSPVPSTWWQDGLRTSVDHGENMLRPGLSHVNYDGIGVSFDVPGEDWEWWEVGTGLRRTPAMYDEYGAAVFFLRDVSVRLQPCRSDRVEALGADPDDLVGNVTPLLDLAHSTVLEGPQVVTAFGGTAVHLRLQTNGTCPELGLDRPAQLRGWFNGSNADPGWEGRHELDLWHVVVPGPDQASILIASWDLDGTARHHNQQQALLDSLRIDAG